MSIEIKNQQYYIDGKPQFLVSGEFHYFRVPREDWKNRLIALKEMSCNCVATYVPWLIHEPEEGNINWASTPNNDLTAFLDLCAEISINVILRPGPLQYAELRDYGLPGWLFDKYPEIQVQRIDGSVFHRVPSYMHPYRMNFKHSDKIVTLTGHTRHSTQGSEKRNYNNHPFGGRCKNVKFALAHNGVLANDRELRTKYHLPKTKIETDSYIAVQLLEYKKVLNSESIKFMAEALEGSFSFSIVDSMNTLWLVKGDSPLHIIHFPKLKLYVYASTEEILWKGLIETEIFDELKSGGFEEIPVHSGDILNILPDGNIVYSKFDYKDYCGVDFRNWWGYGMYCSDSNSYMDDLKSVAVHLGISPDDIDSLAENGFTLEEIEEYIYCL